jgi:hypothetical protein
MALNSGQNRRIVYLHSHQQFVGGISHGPYKYPKEGTTPYSVVEIKDFQLYLPFVAEGSSPRPGPPLNGARLFGFLMSKDTAGSFIGDLEERYGLILDARGRRAATRWFWRQVVHSFFSLAVDALRRLSALEKLIERYRRIGS